MERGKVLEKEDGREVEADVGKSGIEGGKGLLPVGGGGGATVTAKLACTCRCYNCCRVYLYDKIREDRLSAGLRLSSLLFLICYGQGWLTAQVT